MPYKRKYDIRWIKPTPISQNPSHYKKKQTYQKKKPVGSGTANASTFQSDKVVLYRRKPATKRVKAAARRKYKANQAQLLKTLSMQQFRFSDTTDYSIGATAYNTTVSVMMNTGVDSTGVSDSPNSDYYNINNLLKGFINVENTKIHQDHSSMEVILQNTSPEPLTVDVYSIIAKKDFDESARTTYLQGFTDNFFKAAVTPISTAKLGAGDPLIGPFNQSLFGSKFTVQKCERFQLSAANSLNSIVSFNKRSSKNMTWDTNDYQTGTTNLPTIGYKTQGYLIIARRLDPTAQLNNALKVQSVRTYNVKYLARAANTVTSVNP